MKTKKAKTRTKKPVAADTPPADAAVSADDDTSVPVTNTFVTDATASVDTGTGAAAIEAGTGAGDANTVSNTFDTVITKERLHDLEVEFDQRRKAAHEKAAEAIEVILTIKDERQYLADGFKTFDDYMAARWGYTRQWVEQMRMHLKMLRVMQERLGFSPDEATSKLTVYDATILRPLKDDPDVFVIAVKEAEEKYQAADKKSPKILKQVVEKYEHFLSRRFQLEQRDDPDHVGEILAPLTLDEYGLLAQLPHPRCHRLRGGKTLIELARAKAGDEGISLTLAIEQVCVAHRAIPGDEQLLEAARGESLKELVATLAPHAELWKAEDKAKAEAEDEAEETPKAEPEAKTPEQIEQEAEEERRRAEDREKWQWFEDDLSLSLYDDPRKSSEGQADIEDSFQSGPLARIAADCLADACKRISLSSPEELADAVKAAKKAKHWAEELIRECEAAVCDDPQEVSN